LDTSTDFMEVQVFCLAKNYEKQIDHF